MYENYENFIPIIWEGDQHTSPNYSARYSDYGVAALPSSMFNGDNADVGGGAAVYSRYETIYNNTIDIASPMEIDASFAFDAGQIQVGADITLTDDLEDADYRIIYILTNFYDASYNSTVVSYHEEDFTLSNNGDSDNFSHGFDMNPELDLANMRAVVLVQHVNSTGTTTVGDYTFNQYPILQAGSADFPISAPNPIATQNLDLGATANFDLTDFFYYEGEPVDAELGVESSNPSAVTATLNGTDLTIEAGNEGGQSTITITGEYNGYTGASSFIVNVVDPNIFNVVIVDLDTTPTGETLKASIENYYSRGEVLLASDFNQYPINQQVDALFVLLGVYSNNTALTGAQSEIIVDYLNNGGNVYMEGGDTWAYDTQTDAHAMFNINGADDGAGDLDAVTGLNLMEGMSWDYSGESNWIDHLEPLGDATAIFENTDVAYYCGIANDADTYKTIGTSFELAGLGGTNTLDDAVSAIVEFFGIDGIIMLPPTNLAVDVNTGIFTWDAPSTEGLTGYNVYLDGILEDNISNTEYTFTELEVDQTYEAGIEAVYTDGTSEMVSIEFTFEGNSSEDITAVTRLEGNYPNPFNPITNISYAVAKNGKVELNIYNVKGQLIKTLVNDYQEADSYNIQWKGKDNDNKDVASGVYFYQLKADNKVFSNKMLLLK